MCPHLLKSHKMIAVYFFFCKITSEEVYRRDFHELFINALVAYGGWLNRNMGAGTANPKHK